MATWNLTLHILLDSPGLRIKIPILSEKHGLESSVVMVTTNEGQAYPLMPQEELSRIYAARVQVSKP